jgi:hypothetical protein
VYTRVCVPSKTRWVVFFSQSIDACMHTHTHTHKRTHIMTEEYRAVDDDTANQIGETPMVPIIFSDHLLRMLMRHTDNTKSNAVIRMCRVQGETRITGCMETRTCTARSVCLMGPSRSTTECSIPSESIFSSKRMRKESFTNSAWKTAKISATERGLFEGVS